MKVQLTENGFDFGNASVAAVCSDEARGWVVVSITTNKSRIEVYVTKTGKLRVHKDNTELLPSPKYAKEQHEVV